MNANIFPLLVFTVLSGAAAGTYAVATAYVLGAKAEDKKERFILPLVCLVLLGVGLMGTLAHLGQPLRFINGLMHGGSMIAQEAYWSIGLGIVILVDLVFSFAKKPTPRVLRVIGSLAGLGLMVVTSLAYYKCLGVAAWNDASVMVLFIVGDLALGAAIAPLLQNVTQYHVARAVNVVLTLLGVLSLLAFGVSLVAAGANWVPLVIVAEIVWACGVLVEVYAQVSSKASQRTIAIAMLVVTFVGVAVSRYAFFAAGILG